MGAMYIIHASVTEYLSHLAQKSSMFAPAPANTATPSAF